MTIRTTAARHCMIALSAFALMAGASAAHAQERSGRAVITTEDGRTVTRDLSRSRSREDGYRRSSTVTGPNGRTADVDASVSCSGGTCERTVERRGFGGRTSTVEGSGRRVGPGVFEGERAVTGPKGRTRTWRWRRVRD